ncbi:uncharacterized protein LOC133528438 [Cydia pomonella]|uniref:uncharacterized protein LOC133528438 n=1 Tax=Cydia pomonella TaxID=82600 RepID=UPI002ADDB089|nr:uncharacterized protein LOC133528438 [Cydia pomonella]
MAGSADATSEPQTPRTRYCAVYDCTHNHKTHPHLGYFGFPKNQERIKLWAEKIRRPDVIQADGRVSSYYRVCEVHFHPRDINAKGKRRRLQKRAVPMLRLPHRGPYVHVADVAVPTQLQVKGKTLVKSTLEVCEYVGEVPKPKTKKKKKVPQPPKLLPLPTLERFFSDCDQHLPPDTAEFVKLVARLQVAQDNNLCVKLLHSNPQAYRLLQVSLSLPPVSALHRHCAPQLPDFNTAVGLLKTRADQMTDLEKYCTLGVHFVDARALVYYNITFDRIVGLHEVDGTQKPLVATRGVIVTARGLLTNWTQPVATAYICDLGRDDETFNPWIDKIIDRLHSIGLKVHALVCDPTDPPYREVTPEEPFFFVGNTKIYLLYDPPRLMKKLLCEFMAYDFHFDKTRATWSDIQKYRKMERIKALTLTPSLTDASMKPAAMCLMKPQRATRLLSRALATALTDRAEQGCLSDSARATANFIIKINNLYDLLNTNTMKTSSEFQKGLSQDSNQVGFLTYMKTFFKSLKLEDSSGFDKTATRKLSNSWQVTIEAVLALQKDLQPLRPYLLTRNLHLDDSVAERARRALRSGFPSCQQIFSAFKKQFFNEMLQPSLKNVDLNVLLAQVVSDAPNGPISNPMEINDDLPVKPTDYRLLLPKKHSLMSVAKHLLRAASRVHGDCALAVEYLNSPPEPDFLQLVQNLDEALTSALREGVDAGGLLRELLLDVHVLDCALPCACFPLEYLKRLFFRLRLYGILRHNQKHFKRGDSDLFFNNLE